MTEYPEGMPQEDIDAGVSPIADPTDPPIPSSRRKKPKKREWIIDVCKTCGREAKWPFCEHYDPTHSTQKWYETVRVREV
jgi:hypothetical protein